MLHTVADCDQAAPATGGWTIAQIHKVLNLIFQVMKMMMIVCSFIIGDGNGRRRDKWIESSSNGGVQVRVQAWTRETGTEPPHTQIGDEQTATLDEKVRVAEHAIEWRVPQTSPPQVHSRT